MKRQLAVLLSAILVVLVVAAAVQVFAYARRPIPPPQTTATTPPFRTIVVGTGLSAAAFLYFLSPGLRASVSLRESSSRAGGRVLTTTQTIQPVNTAQQAFEYGAWAFDSFTSARTMAVLLSLQVPLTPQVQLRSRSFVYAAGVRTSWPGVPKDLVDPGAWRAFTNLGVSDLTEVSVSTLTPFVLPEFCLVPTGLGWQGVVLRGLGLRPVTYGKRLQRLSVSGGWVTLEYADGTSERVRAVLLTCSPKELADIAGVLPEVLAAMESLVSVTQGILYATWTAQTAGWMEAQGFVAAAASTDLPVGRVITINSNVLRCEVSGSEDVTFWTEEILRRGMTSACAQVQQQLQAVFPDAEVSAPESVSFRGWPAARCLWRGGVDIGATRQLLQRPCGAGAPVWWSSGDIGADQGTVEGCLAAAEEAAAAWGTLDVRVP